MNRKGPAKALNKLIKIRDNLPVWVEKVIHFYSSSVLSFDDLNIR
jgi:hypothetical protein